MSLFAARSKVALMAAIHAALNPGIVRRYKPTVFTWDKEISAPRVRSEAEKARRKKLRQKRRARINKRGF